jgi:hypothetical protein
MHRTASSESQRPDGMRQYLAIVSGIIIKSNAFPVVGYGLRAYR